MKLLRNAVELLNKYKDILAHENPPRVEKKKKTPKK